MGYKISSLLAVSPNDIHSYFIYFIPTPTFQYNWINDYVNANFERLASSVGPKGVIIAPLVDKSNDFWSPRIVEEYLEKQTGLKENGCYFNRRNISERDSLEAFLHRHRPFLIFSQTPITSEKKGNAIVIDLSGSKDISIIGQIFDSIIETIKSDNFNNILKFLPDLELTIEDEHFNNIIKYFELKPNVFGVGVNLNEIISLINKRLLKKTYIKSNKEKDFH